jgi:hypothetical protein
MAIVKVGTYRNPPEDITDYEAIVAHLEAYTRQVGNQGMILTEWTNTTNAPKIAMGSYISHGGVLYVVEDEDYLLPSLSSDGTYYIRVAVSGDTLALDYITDLTGYVWNAIYNGLYHPDGKQVLPYQVAKNASAIEKYKMLNPWQVDDFAVVDYLGRYHGRELHVTGAISGATVNTGQGDFKIGQNLRTTDSPTFDSIITNTGDIKILSGLRKLTGYARNNGFQGGLAWWGSFNSIFSAKGAPSGYYTATGAIMEETTNKEFIVAFIYYLIDTEVNIYCYQIGVGGFGIITISPTSSTKYKGVIGI